MKTMERLNSSRRTFLKQLGVGTASLGLLRYVPECLSATGQMRKALPRSTPEAQGIDSQAVLDFLQAIAGSKHEFHSFMLLRHGYVVTEAFWAPYRPSAPQMMYSMSKSFTSTAIGFAVSERRLSVEDTVISFFPDKLPVEISENLKELRVKHLLSMSVGHAQDSTGSLWGENDWVRKFLSLPIANKPGSAFLYNSGATYMLSAIISKVMGQNLVGYLSPRLFEPLRIEGISWETCPHGINTGGWGLKIVSEGLAKFGQLYLQKGEWNGAQLLPSAWVKEATSFKIQQPAPDLERAKKKSDWHQGYCYQFWRSRHDAYRGDGAFGQYTVVMPAQDAVVAITSETSDMQGVLNLVWDHLLPAMKPAALPANRQLESRLKRHLEALELSKPSGSAESPVAAKVSAHSLALDQNEMGAHRVSVKFQKGSCTFVLADNSGNHAVRCGLGRWFDGETDMPGTPPKLTQGKLPPVSKVSAAAAWKDDRTLQMIWRFYETPHHDEVTCRFDNDTVTVTFLDSMAAMNPSRKDKRPVLHGRVSS